MAMSSLEISLNAVSDAPTPLEPQLLMRHAIFLTSPSVKAGGFLWAAGFWFLIDGGVYGSNHDEDLNVGLYFTTIGAALAGVL
jgi:hypothetical protein